MMNSIQTVREMNLTPREIENLLDELQYYQAFIVHCLLVTVVWRVLAQRNAMQQ